ncbi:little elongation complex subunit 2 [Cochliomyia hominivorax]
MSNFDYLEYKGHSIFRNQPNHAYFDKPLDEQDCLFQCLHEIEAHFLKPEQQTENLNSTYNIVLDPRTKNPITNLYYDHSQEEKTKLFAAPKRSTMTERDHELGVRVLNALQLGFKINDEDMYDWHRLTDKRLQEKQNFQKFVFEFAQTNKEKMYVPCHKLLELYRKWFKNRAIKLMEKYSSQSYNTHLGLPHVNQCKNFIKDYQLLMEQQEIITKSGETCKWQDYINKEFIKFNHSIESYFNVYTNSEDIKDSLEKELQTQFVSMIEKEEISETAKLYIPLESLLFLVTAGDYIDMPTEMILNIKEYKSSESDFNKYIIMDLPLPSRQGGWHTYQQVVQQSAIAVVSLQQTSVTEERKSLNMEESFKNFRVFPLQEFMQKNTQRPDKLCKFSKLLMKWHLRPNLADETPLEIYTSLDNFTENKDWFLKLEYKPRFGCEVLTKYDLLKQWFQFKLLKSFKSSCFRLDVTNFQLLLEESLTLNKLEEALNVNYNINCQQLLNNLYEFLIMLYQMPLGHYMLRFNAKYKDKLMLCKPSQEITQNTIHLHQLLQTEVTDLDFMSQQDFLAIDANLCSLMHLQHTIIPAAFSPRAKFDKSFHNRQKKLPELKKTAKEVKTSLMNKMKKKRERRRQRLIENFKAQRNEQNELNREIEMDRKLLGN